MKLSRQRHALFVEGTDDQFVIANLLEASEPEVELDRFIRAPGPAPSRGGAVGAAIQLFVNELAAQKLERVGLVIDANGNPSTRLDEVRRALAKEGIVAPTGALERFEFQTGRVAGVWLMPDNSSAGALEDFLWPMVGESLLSSWASEATKIAKAEKAAPFSNERKATLRTWLAWQSQAGLPPGEAVRRGLLNTASAAAFVSWAKQLFIS